MVLDLFKLDGRVAIVTGAGRGIGQALAYGLAQAGADVACVTRGGNSAETRRLVESCGRVFLDVQADLGKPDQRAGIVEWIAARIKEGESARMAKRERVSYRRLTREEYVHTVRDLIGVHYDATDPGGLFEDPQWHGFERIGSVLTLSPSHIEKYIKAAEVVLDEAYPVEPIEYREASKRAGSSNSASPSACSGFATCTISGLKSGRPLAR